MKRADAVASLTPDLVRKRALIRVLIEQNGWETSYKPTPAAMERRPQAESNYLPDNVIPFPFPER